jgi:AcrR family transcriptional regulator
MTIKKAHISEHKFQQLVRLFSTNLGVSQIARLTGINRKTVNRYLTKLQRLFEYYFLILIRHLYKQTRCPLSRRGKIKTSLRAVLETL